MASEPRERSAPSERRARERVGELEGRSPSNKKEAGVQLETMYSSTDGRVATLD
jgi:hypothetical protein